MGSLKTTWEEKRAQGLWRRPLYCRPVRKGEVNSDSGDNEREGLRTPFGDRLGSIW